jgi:hypothetical protein
MCLDFRKGTRLATHLTSSKIGLRGSQVPLDVPLPFRTIDTERGLVIIAKG